MSDPHTGYRAGQLSFEGAVVIGALKKLRNWLTLKDVHAEQRSAEEELATRYSRGNTSVQNGWYVDETGVRKLAKKGDRAFLRARRLIDAAKSKTRRYAGTNKG